MRIARALTTLLAVLCGAVMGAGDAMGNVSRVHRASLHHPHRVLTDEELDATAAWKRSHWREMQDIMRHEGARSERGEVECCPSVQEMVEKEGGRTVDGLFVELYKDGENKQRFYELSCAPDVANKPCRFVDSRLYNQSVCRQKYSKSYALVRHSPSQKKRQEGHFNVPGSIDGGWSLDYIEVRAGCECQILPKRRPKKRPNRQRHKRKNKKFAEDDDT